MTMICIDPKREEILFREMRKAHIYFEPGIEWRDIKRHRREIRIERATRGPGK